MTRGQLPPATPDELADWLLVQIEDLESEAQAVYEFALHQPFQQRGLFVQTLYAYMARCFALLDRLSVHITPKENQTVRMVLALEQWAGIDREAASVALHLWRHGLMHTAEARKASNSSGQVYRWLLQWGAAELPDKDNWTFAVDSRGERILNLSLLRLVGDLHRAFSKYAAELSASPDLQAKAVGGFAKLQRKDRLLRVV